MLMFWGKKSWTEVSVDKIGSWKKQGIEILPHVKVSRMEPLLVSARRLFLSAVRTQVGQGFKESKVCKWCDWNGLITLKKLWDDRGGRWSYSEKGGGKEGDHPTVLLVLFLVLTVYLHLEPYGVWHSSEICPLLPEKFSTSWLVSEI